jgi:uncharacterized protein (DUF302 family)
MLFQSSPWGAFCLLASSVRVPHPTANLNMIICGLLPLTPEAEMEHVGGFAHKLSTTLPFDTAIEKVTELLQGEGFGILTEIDVTGTMKKKLDVDYKPYRILGACNPPFAHQALEAENLVGVMMPCNVVVWDDGDHRVVATMDARMISQVIDKPAVRDMANLVNAKLESVLSRLEQLG